MTKLNETLEPPKRLIWSNPELIRKVPGERIENATS